MMDDLQIQVPEEVEDVRTLYFTVNMSTKSRRMSLVRPLFHSLSIPIVAIVLMIPFLLLSSPGISDASIAQ